MKTHGIASHLLSTSTTKQINLWKLPAMDQLRCGFILGYSVLVVWLRHGVAWLHY